MRSCRELLAPWPPPATPVSRRSMPGACQTNAASASSQQPSRRRPSQARAGQPWTSQAAVVGAAAAGHGEHREAEDEAQQRRVLCIVLYTRSAVQRAETASRGRSPRQPTLSPRRRPPWSAGRLGTRGWPALALSTWARWARWAHAHGSRSVLRVPLRLSCPVLSCPACPLLLRPPLFCCSAANCHDHVPFTPVHRHAPPSRASVSHDALPSRPHTAALCCFLSFRRPCCASPFTKSSPGPECQPSLNCCLGPRFIPVRPPPPPLSTPPLP